MSSQDVQTASTKEPAFAALYHRDFRFFFVGTMLAMMADNIEHVVSYWLLFEKFHSPVLAAFAFRLFRRYRRSIRLPKGCPACANPVHGCVGNVGHPVFHE